MDIDVRRIAAEEFAAWSRAVSTGFLETSSEAAIEAHRVDVVLDRTWAAVDGGRIVGTLRSFPTPLTVPGGSVPASALSAVTVTATHRRRGLLTRMMTADLRAAAERGEPVAILIASEFGIYGRFGFGPATEQVSYDVDTVRARLARRPTGSVELVEPAMLRGDAPGVYERHRTATPGAIAREGRWWDRWLGITPLPGHEPGPRFFVRSFDEDGATTGYLGYHVEHRWAENLPRHTLVVDELMGADPEATARLWAYCVEVDLIARVRTESRGPGEVLPWLLSDGRSAQQHLRTDALWLRLLDPAAALTARRYPLAGGLVLEVHDALGLAAGRFALEAGTDGATCAPTTRIPDLTLDVSVLASAYLGGHPLRLLADAGYVDEHRDGAVVAADALLRSPTAPWCATGF